MPLISYFERKIKPKGVKANYVLNEAKFQEYFFADELNKLSSLNNINVNISEKNPTLFYPGCGVDILTPLLYVKKLFKQKKFTFIFLDKEPCLGMIKTVLDDLDVPFSCNREELNFYWKGKFITLRFILGDVFKKALPKYDIYFEKSFRIMKDQFHGYEEKVVSSLEKGGVIIADSGFQGFPLNYLDVDRDLSSYGEMIMATK